jgi:hypothetical protein
MLRVAGVERSEINQALLDCTGGRKYLEIGVATGATFHAINAAEKTAVDPRFLFDIEAARAEHSNSTYWPITSDEYFATCPAIPRFDVVFIDGLHVFEQVLRDFLNVLSHLQDRGVIIIDDVRPYSYASSLADEAVTRKIREATGDSDDAWMGDVFKLISFIDTFMPEWSYSTVKESHGVAVVWQKSRRLTNTMKFTDIGALSFADVISGVVDYKIRPFGEILEEYRSNAIA